MKNYLLTWYGITDLRCALGFEESDGPVLAALKSGEYSDVMILGYTNNNKSAPETSISINNFDELSSIDLYSNTTSGHKLYEDWLKKKLSNYGIKTNLFLIPTKLQKLNDAKGIYTAVSDCIENISTIDNEKCITVFLSPGTPLMAFTWAFVSLVNPALNIRVIASSDFRDPPEEILLPYELLDLIGQHQDENSPTMQDFDVMFHLFGAQRIPSLLGILQFKSKIHIFVNSKKYPADVMKQFIGDSEFKELPVNAFDPKNVEMTILQTISTLPNKRRIGFNLTGGTKLMFIGALAASDKVSGTPFYFETQGNNLVFLKDYSFYQTIMIENVETFIRANTNNLKISNKGFLEDDSERNKFDKKSLTMTLWNNRNKISKLYKELSIYNDDPGKSFDIKRGVVHAKLNSKGDAQILIGDEKFCFVNWLNFAKYLSGGWLEEFVYLTLKPLLRSGKIKDLRIGMEISFVGNENQRGMDWRDKLRNIYGEIFQELDIVLTDGRSLFIIECKAGNIKSADVMKLQNIVRYYGGVEGKGFLVSAFKPKNNVVKRKINESKNITLISGDQLSSLLKEIV